MAYVSMLEQLVIQSILSNERNVTMDTVPKTSKIGSKDGLVQKLRSNLQRRKTDKTVKKTDMKKKTAKTNKTDNIYKGRLRSHTKINYYSKKRKAKNVVKKCEETYCICRQVQYGTMVECENPNCSIGWFHFPCVGLSAEPKGHWFCLKCRLPERKNKEVMNSARPKN